MSLLMRSNISLFLVILSLCICFDARIIATCFAQAPTPGSSEVAKTAETTLDATTLFNQGKFQEALTGFETSIEKNPGISKAELCALYHNIGATHYRLGHQGQALAYFEKALSMAPQNEDILYNYGLVFNSLKKTGLLNNDQTFLSGTISPFAKRLPVAFLWFFVALALAITGAALQKMRSSQTKLNAPKGAATLGAGLTLAFLFLSLIFARRLSQGVVIAESSQARSGPGTQFTELFRLSAGTRFEILDQNRENWQQIRFSHGNVGWIMQKDFLQL